MGTYARAFQLAQQLADQDIRVTADPAAAIPPCVLITPPTRTYDLPLPSYSVTWSLVCLAPGPGGVNAWAALDELVDAVVDALELDGTTATPGSYQLPTAPEPHPAYIITMTEGTDL